MATSAASEKISIQSCTRELKTRRGQALLPREPVTADRPFQHRPQSRVFITLAFAHQEIFKSSPICPTIVPAPHAFLVINIGFFLQRKSFPAGAAPLLLMAPPQTGAAFQFMLCPSAQWFPSRCDGGDMRSEFLLPQCSFWKGCDTLGKHGHFEASSSPGPILAQLVSVIPSLQTQQKPRARSG